MARNVFKMQPRCETLFYMQYHQGGSILGRTGLPHPQGHHLEWDWTEIDFGGGWPPRVRGRGEGSREQLCSGHRQEVTMGLSYCWFLTLAGACNGQGTLQRGKQSLSAVSLSESRCGPCLIHMFVLIICMHVYIHPSTHLCTRVSITDNHRAHIFLIRYSIQGMVVITLIYFFLIKPLWARYCNNFHFMMVV